MATTFTRAQLEEKTVSELREICVYDLGIRGMTKKRKDVIIDAILAKASARPKTPSTPVSSASSQDVTAIEATLTSNLTKPGAAFGNRATTTVRVSSGASSGNFDVAGKSVGAVASFLREVLNVDQMAKGLVNGKEVEDSYVLKSGDILEFLKPAGRKG